MTGGLQMMEGFCPTVEGKLSLFMMSVIKSLLCGGGGMSSVIAC